jgi:hypothetical protein
MMMRAVAHVLQACTVLAMLGSAVAIAAKPAAQQSAPQSSAPKPLALGETETPREEHFAYWYRQFMAQKGLAAKGEICIRSASCISDEGDFLRHAEMALKIQRGIEAWAARGNHDAAFYAGRIAFEAAQGFDNEFLIYSNHQDYKYREAGRRFIALSDRELQRAKSLLMPAAYDQRPESCMLMGDILAYEKLSSRNPDALVFYYCAAREYFTGGKRDLSMKAYGEMLRHGNHNDPMIVEVHARLFNQQPPNPWRPLTPSKPSN